MDKVVAKYPDWRRVRPAIPSDPCVFTSVDSVPVRQYEAALMAELPWPTTTTPRDKGTCVRAMASQLLPLIQEYTQLRDHLQGYLGMLHIWHTEVLMPHLEKMEEEMHVLKLRAFVHGQTGVTSRGPPSAAPSLISAPSSVAESIAEAQAVAASLRGQGPSVVFCGPTVSEALNPDEGWAGEHTQPTGQAAPTELQPALSLPEQPGYQ